MLARVEHAAHQDPTLLNLVHCHVGPVGLAVHGDFRPGAQRSEAVVHAFGMAVAAVGEACANPHAHGEAGNRQERGASEQEDACE